MGLPQQSEVKNYYKRLQLLLESAHGKHELFQIIVNAPFHDKKRTALMSLGIVTLLLVNPKTKLIDRVAFSDTEMAKGAAQISVKAFEDIKIPLHHPMNVTALAIRTGKPAETDDWQYLFVPELSTEEARFSQAGAGVGYSIAWPLVGVREGGAINFSYYEEPHKIGKLQRDFMKTYCAMIVTKLKTQ